MKQEQLNKLNEPLPSWAVKPHPTKTNMTAIHPMAVIDRLNEVFGVGAWIFETDFISCDAFNQEVAVYKNGTKTDEKKNRTMYMSAVKGTLKVMSEGIHIEQYGGSSNEDRGDALKGGATDALTKCASYLGVGASIYKGQGNETNDTQKSVKTAPSGKKPLYEVYPDYNLEPNKNSSIGDFTI